MPPVAVSLGYILLIALWGSTWAAIKIGVDAVPPFVSHSSAGSRCP